MLLRISQSNLLYQVLTLFVPPLCHLYWISLLTTYTGQSICTPHWVKLTLSRGFAIEGISDSVRTHWRLRCLFQSSWGLLAGRLWIDKHFSCMPERGHDLWARWFLKSICVSEGDSAKHSSSLIVLWVKGGPNRQVAVFLFFFFPSENLAKMSASKCFSWEKRILKKSAAVCCISHRSCRELWGMFNVFRHDRFDNWPRAPVRQFWRHNYNLKTFFSSRPIIT